MWSMVLLAIIEVGKLDFGSELKFRAMDYGVN